MDAETIAEMVNRISQPDSDESDVFRKVLSSTSGVTQVGKIIPKVPAYIIQETIMTTSGAIVEEAPATSKAFVIPVAFGGTAGFAVIALFSYKCRRGAGHLKGSLSTQRWLEREDAGSPNIERVPSNTLLESFPTKVERKMHDFALPHTIPQQNDFASWTTG